MHVLLVGSVEANAKTKALLKKSAHQIVCWPSAGDGLEDDLPWAPDIPVTEVARLAHVAKINLVILTTEDAVQSGIANVLQVYRIPCFGPTRVAAHFLWDPEYLVKFALQHGVSMTAESVHYTPADAMRAALQCISIHRRIAIRTRNARGETNRFVCTSRDDVKQVMALTAPTGRPDAVQYLIERDAVEAPKRFVYLVSGTRALLVRPTEVSANPGPKIGDDVALQMSETVVQPFVRGLAQEETPYTGWLTFDVSLRGKVILVRSVGCLPEPSFLDDLIRNDPRDWLQLISFVMHGLASVETNQARCA